jgi:hypothetical protein
MARRIPPQACQGFPDISKRSVIGAFDEGHKTREFLESLDDDKWQVTAWEPENRLVCFDATADTGQIHHYTIDIPVISVSWLK